MRDSKWAALVAIAAAITTSTQTDSSEQRRLYPGDAFRLCSSVIPNVEGVTICVRKQKASLTAGCKTVFDKPIVTTASTEKAPSPD